MRRERWEGTPEFAMYELGLGDGRDGNLPVRVQDAQGVEIPEDHPVQLAWNDGYADGGAEVASQN